MEEEEERNLLNPTQHQSSSRRHLTQLHPRVYDFFQCALSNAGFKLFVKSFLGVNLMAFGRIGDHKDD